MSLCNKFITQNSTKVKKDNEHALHIRTNYWFLIFWPRRTRGLLERLLLGFWGFLYTHIITFDYLWKEFWLFQASLESHSKCCHDCPSAPLSANGAQIGSFLTNVQTDTQNALNWPKWTSEHVSNFMDSDYSLSEDKFLHSINIFVCFAHWWMSHVNDIFKRSRTAFVKPQKLVFIHLPAL